ncbi:hypothetical protein Scep_014606 [Stephania cephalantha]|uniref:Vacuolar protein sorting-associated protein 62 n=1 Tax=Stephania cephalantha TaxID=152367 RepID=A0AAP0J2Y0_9MAGN
MIFRTIFFLTLLSQVPAITGNIFSSIIPPLFGKKKSPPIETVFKLPSPLPVLPQGEGFATGTINLGGLEVSQVSTFSKIWATHEGGPDNLGVTFFEPLPILNGFFMLGCYAQPNKKALFGWVLAGKDGGTGALKMPVDYTLVWSSESSKIKQEGNGYIWLPVPPNGYKPVGYLVTNSPEKPPLDKIRCVCSDFTDDVEPELLIWEHDNVGNFNDISVKSLRPTNRGTQALGVSVGTFVALVNDSSSPLPISCLKNKEFNLSFMPNLSQIEGLIQAYAPLVYIHPDDLYLPSSVGWFFSNGARLYKKGNESNHVPIDPTGLNLPQGGSDDGSYWIDLPVDNGAKEKVKKGDLGGAGAYFHIKPMLGATFSDIAIWVFYPFNGPARAKVELVSVPLGRIGEHVGDWEHITLRISNFNGELWRVYFSQHSGGTWVDASEVEFQGGKNKVLAYASLHGHAFYSKPGLFLQGNNKIGIGIRDDAAKSEIVMDTGSRFAIVSAKYFKNEVISVPPWLNFYGKWGPKADYDIAMELEKIERVLPRNLKASFESAVNGLPNELLGEDGPTGPKAKDNWNGDER